MPPNINKLTTDFTNSRDELSTVATIDGEDYNVTRAELRAGIDFGDYASPESADIILAANMADFTVKPEHGIDVTYGNKDYRLDYTTTSADEVVLYLFITGKFQ
jgi:hypothetical protein